MNNRAFRSLSAAEKRDRLSRVIHSRTGDALSQRERAIHLPPHRVKIPVRRKIPAAATMISLHCRTTIRFPSNFSITITILMMSRL